MRSSMGRSPRSQTRSNAGSANVERRANYVKYGLLATVIVYYLATKHVNVYRYVEPFWINNTNFLPSELADDNDSFILGLGTKVRIRPTVYLFVEGAPRVAGHDPGVDHVSFGIEKRAGGHNFQLNFSNSFGTAFGQIARGGGSNDDWYLGFNISRKFF